MWSGAYNVQHGQVGLQRVNPLLQRNQRCVLGSQQLLLLQQHRSQSPTILLQVT
jgi:hypothetical protein